MSFLANISDFYFKKIAIENVFCESEVGNCWIGLSLAAECGFMHLSYTRDALYRWGYRLLPRSASGLGG